MWRVLIVVGLTVTTMASAEARGFGRISFRVRVPPRSFMHPTDRRVAPVILHKRQDEAMARPPVASILDNPAPAAGRAPASPTPQAAVGKTADRSAHWCDNGKLVGSGAGFCVLDVGNGASS